MAAEKSFNFDSDQLSNLKEKRRYGHRKHKSYFQTPNIENNSSEEYYEDQRVKRFLNQKVPKIAASYDHGGYSSNERVKENKSKTHSLIFIQIG